MKKPFSLRSSLPAMLLLQFALPLTVVPRLRAESKKAETTETKEESTPAKTPKTPKTPKAEKAPKADNSKPAAKTPKTPKPAASVKNIPFHGIVTAVDPEAKTVTLGTKVFNITDATLVVDGDKSAVLKDVKVGRKIGGSYHVVKSRNEVVKLNLGVKQEPTPAKPKKTK